MFHTVSVQADFKNYTVAIKPIGFNPCGLNGLALEQNKIYTAVHGDRLAIIHDKYFHEIVFDPAPPPPSVAKRKSEDLLESNVDSTNRAKRLKNDDNFSKLQPAAENKWEHIDDGKLLIYTAKDVVASNKVCYAIY